MLNISRIFGWNLAGAAYREKVLIPYHACWVFVYCMDRVLNLPANSWAHVVTQTHFSGVLVQAYLLNSRQALPPAGTYSLAADGQDDSQPFPVVPARLPRLLNAWICVAGVLGVMAPS